MTLALQEEMRLPASANNESFNFKMDDTTRARESYLQQVEDDTRQHIGCNAKLLESLSVILPVSC